ncbi:alternative ribosome rescue aminoacyl-tRNA hydrolase ArfB [Fulvimarina sp. 2208YS6-2-32]|uniref:Alternative ribosome rescue aminoacyl-tRNA hydrolase ArfB n=1 Tax=Fulvimarina uroteuthidis TaxID=3098149 RepID=A0ABU5I7R7_9HYPH|nr:alternative ribosome rescue aminoacyl-tRNA hydrolase ArfB [Fulvimarina sp. 2208YS6-2-32]MDY8110256.1 alternative ribosome rescue aminoacyl-tRNA hydrolase ArfB [Fulvimarina sp. 2208YS6-2-32]
MPDPLVITHRITIPDYEMAEQFLTAGGPGGQNVNKVASAVQLRFYAAQSGAISPDAKRRLIKLAGRRATKEGEILIEASRHRTQERNREDARDRLRALVIEALKPPPPPRKKTRPSRGSIERRIKEKKGRGAIKAMRGRVDDG